MANNAPTLHAYRPSAYKTRDGSHQVTLEHTDKGPKFNVWRGTTVFLKQVSTLASAKRAIAADLKKSPADV